MDNLSLYDMNTEMADEALRNVYRMSAMIEGMTAERASAAMNVEITGQVESLGKDQIQTFFYTHIMIFALYGHSSLRADGLR